MITYKVYFFLEILNIKNKSWNYVSFWFYDKNKNLNLIYKLHYK